MKNKIFLLFAGVAFGPSLIFVLFLSSNRLNNGKNNFIRKIAPHFVTHKDSFELQGGSWTMAGSTHSRTYLSSDKYVNVIAEFLWETKTRKFHQIKHPTGERLGSPKIQIDSPRFFIIDGSFARIYDGYVGAWQPRIKAQLDRSFSYLVILSDASFACSIVDPKQGFVLGLKILNNERFQIVNNILDKNQKSVLANDGMLTYNKTKKKIVYVYYYRNKFVVADSSLKQSFYGNTIDTVSTVRVSDTKVGDEITISSPTTAVNRLISTDGNSLFVCSRLIADNEDKKTVANLEVIDVYSLVNGKYRYSFYIQNHKGYHLKDFKVTNGHLFGLFDNGICRYKINPKYAKQL